MYGVTIKSFQGSWTERVNRSYQSMYLGGYCIMWLCKSLTLYVTSLQSRKWITALKTSVKQSFFQGYSKEMNKMLYALLYFIILHEISSKI